MFKFRRATQSDKERVLEISSKIWEGNDYIEFVFDEWVKDEEGEFTIGEKAGNVVGFAKYTKHSATEAWLEGIRVDEAYANQGFGKEITKYHVRKAKEEGIEVIRLSAYVGSKESIRIAEGLGLKKDGCFTTGMVEVSRLVSKPPVPPNVINIMSTATAWDLITRGNAYYMSNGYVSFGWTFKKASYELIDRLVREKCVYGVLRDGKVASIMILTDDSHLDGGLNIGFIDGDMGAMKELVDFAANQAVKLGRPYYEIMAPMDERLISVLELSEFEFLSKRYREMNVFVYSMKLIG